MSFSNSGVMRKPHVHQTTSGRFRVIDPNCDNVSPIPRHQSAANNQKGSYPNLAHITRAEAQKMAISLMRTGEFARTGKLDQSLANVLIHTVLKNEASLHHFVAILNKELAGKKSMYTVNIRIDAAPVGTNRQTVKDFLVDVYDFLGKRVDGFVHRIDTERAISMNPARRWFRSWA